MSSDSALLKCGVPQGLLLGPELFTNYCSPTCEVAKSYGISAHYYADNTQLYAPFIPGETESTVLEKLRKRISYLRTWKNADRLKLHDIKTDFIIFDSAYNLKKVKTTTISISEEHITASSLVRSIGACMDKYLEMDIHIVNTHNDISCTKLETNQQ